MPFDLAPPPKLWTPPKFAIIRSRELPRSLAEEKGIRTKLGMLPGMAAMWGARESVLTVITPVAVDTSFTHAAGGAAEANMYDGDDTTPFADPSGANTSTHAAYQFSVAREIRQLRFITWTTHGFTNAMTVNIGHSDTSLTTGFTNVDTMVIPAGLGQVVVKDIAAFGAHLYWRIFYNAGTTGGNAWGGEFSQYASV